MVLASAAAAKKFWPSGGAIGHRVRFGARPGPDRIEGEIVGIVGDVRDAGLAREPVPFFYAALEQISVDSVSVVVETSVPPRQLARPAAAAVASLDRDIPAAGMQTIGDVLDRALARQRFATLLLTLFAERPSSSPRSGRTGFSPTRSVSAGASSASARRWAPLLGRS